jgi:hypothetical protein
VALSATSTSSFATPQQTWRTRMTTLSADTLRTLFLRTGPQYVDGAGTPVGNFFIWPVLLRGCMHPLETVAAG